MAENYDVGERFWRTILWFICQPLPPQLQKKQPQSLNAAIKSLSKRVSMYCNVQVSEGRRGWHFWESQTTRGSATNYYQLYINRVMALDVHYIPSHKDRRKVEPRADIRGRGWIAHYPIKRFIGSFMVQGIAIPSAFLDWKRLRIHMLFGRKFSFCECLLV